MPLRISNKWRQTSLGLFSKDIFFTQHIVTANSTRHRPRDKNVSLNKTQSSASLAFILFSHILFSINIARGSICLVRAGKGGVGYLSLWRLHGEHGHLTGEQRTPERRHRPPFALSARPSRWVLLPWNKEQKKKTFFFFSQWRYFVLLSYLAPLFIDSASLLREKV